MQLASLKNEIKYLKLILHKRSQSKFTWNRDNENNLIITLGNNETITLPLVNLRPYQQEIQDKLFIENYKRFFLVRPRRSGKEIESWSLLIQSALTAPGLYLMIYPTNVRARLVLWAILLNDNFEGKSLRFLNMIPKQCITAFSQIKESVNLKILLITKNAKMLWKRSA